MFVVLCGGSGTRMATGTFPKPLTPIMAAPVLSFALRHVVAGGAGPILFVYSSHLKPYNFEHVVINLFKNTKCQFVCLDYNTRGAVETALAGLLRSQVPLDEPVVFLDNDNIYAENIVELAKPSTAIMGFDYDTSTSTAFSFVQMTGTDHIITAVAEKRRISDTMCTGVYGFASRAQFEQWARHTLQHGPRVNNEIYMSSIFVNMVAAGLAVHGRHVPVEAVGTAEMADEFCAKSGVKLRLCFDLDNTLVTYPTVPGDYSTVKPIKEMIDFARESKARGHTVIVHTARRTGTHGGDVGAAGFDIGEVTSKTLDALGIPCDEIVFGKPAADIYIDDQAVNPYLQSIRAMGIPWAPAHPDRIPSKLPNKQNRLFRVEPGGVIVKAGPEASLRAQSAYYQTIQGLPTIKKYFPDLLAPATPVQGIKGRVEMKLSVVKGVPMSTLMSYSMLEPYHVDMLGQVLSEVHGSSSPAPTVDEAQLRQAFSAKLTARYGNSEAFPYADAGQVHSTLLSFVSLCPCLPAAVTHGNLLLSNVLLTGGNDIKLIGMKGCTGTAVTTYGDRMVDYACIAMSLLGYDHTLFGLEVPSQQVQLGLLHAYVSHLHSVSVQPSHMLHLALAIACAGLPCHPSSEVRDRMWRWLTDCLDVHKTSRLPSPLAQAFMQ